MEYLEARMHGHRSAYGTTVVCSVHYVEGKYALLIGVGLHAPVGLDRNSSLDAVA